MDITIREIQKNGEVENMTKKDKKKNKNKNKSELIISDTNTCANEKNMNECSSNKIRLHLLGIPHTLLTDEFTNCAYTGKVLRFSPMMISRGFEVYYYGTEGSVSGASRQINLLTKKEWDNLRVVSYQFLHPELSIDDVNNRLSDSKNFTSDLANWDTPLYTMFNKRLALELPKYYRGQSTDLVCIPYTPECYDECLNKLDVVTVETGIGYYKSKHTYRIFESYALKHKELGNENLDFCSHYWFVVPNYYNILEWHFVPVVEKKRIGFLGRIMYGKGCDVFRDVAKCFPHVEFIICGQGDATCYMEHPNMIYKPPIFGMERSDYLGNLTAVICPSLYVEPFCGVNVEAQLCGTPVIATDFGAFVETIENFKTGLLCHTLSDFCLGVQMALDGKFDRKYIRDRAVDKYDMYNLGKQYEYAFKCMIDRHNDETNGWYSPYNHMVLE